MSDGFHRQLGSLLPTQPIPQHPVPFVLLQLHLDELGEGARDPVGTCGWREGGCFAEGVVAGGTHAECGVATVFVFDDGA